MRRPFAIALAVAVLLYLLTRTRAGSDAVDQVTASIMDSVRGLRNNNPGNLRWSASNNWEGQTGKDANGYAIFVDMPAGLRAMALVLSSYFRAGINTPREIAYRYAPPRDNNPTEAYAVNVANALEVAPDDPIPFDALPQLLRAMVRQELGSVASAFVSDGEILEGIQRAGL